MARDAARWLAVIALGWALVPEGAAAQTDVYLPGQLTAAPKILSMDGTARMIQMSYPENLRSRGVGGTVQLQFIIGPDGRVEEESIEIIAASVAELGEAAKRVAARLEFSAPKVNEKAVRVRVMLPIVYKPS
jgi:protein TonB